MIDSAGNGATVTFDYIKFINIKGITKEIDKIPYHFNKPKDSIPFKSEAVQEVHKLRSFSFISGTVYFADCSFPNVLSVKASDTLVFY